MAGRKPDWNLYAMNPSNSSKGRIGAAWTNDDGSINIKLNPFVSLNAIDDVQIRLFPYENLSPEEFAEKRRKKEQASAANPSKDKRTTPGYAGEPPDYEDEIPF